MSGVTGLPGKLTASAWLVADCATGEVLASNAAHRRLAPASTLKMLFADTVLKKFDRTERYTVTEADLADIPAGSSLVGVKPGITYTVEQLWQGVFLRSGNDAVHVLAHMNGGVARTVAEMQAKAEDLQALDTHVVSPDGFDHKGQLSSAYDLTLFARHGLKNADFREYCPTRTANFPAGGRKTFQIQNTDRLLTGACGREDVRRTDRGQERIHQQRRQHLHRCRHPRRPDSAGHRDASEERLQRCVRGDGRPARLGLHEGEFGAGGGRAGRAAERGRGEGDAEPRGGQGGGRRSGRRVRALPLPGGCWRARAARSPCWRAACGRCGGGPNAGAGRPIDVPAAD